MGRVYGIEESDGAPGRDTIGGRPILAAGQEWPRCGCGARMVFFFQVDVPRDLPPFGGSHLLVFQCADHNDATFTQGAQLPPAFWERPVAPDLPAFWAVLLNPPGPEAIGEADPVIGPVALAVRPRDEVVDGVRGSQGWKLGGVPSWAQDPEALRCACGAEMVFVCQVPENRELRALPGQKKQKNWFSATNYALLLGNEVYVVACAARCDPRAVWPITQS